KKRAETYDPGHVKNGLVRLDNLFVMRSIRGDGHCLFRSAIADVLEKLLAMTNAERKTRLTQLQLACAKFGKAALNEHFAFLKQVIEAAVASGRAFGDIICDEVTSDKFVSFLRQLVCEHNRQIKNDVFDSFLLAQGKSKNEYLEDMMSMQKAIYGDHPEVLAISTLFNLNICVVEVAEYGKNTDPDKTGQAFRHIRAHDGMMELFLLHRPGHYDLGRLKNRRPQEPVEPPHVRGTRYFIELAKEKGWIVVKA
ncbi:MAG TPA: hypothetical protein VN457_01365, partial [Chlamydiales bacterium]|nr:hypothetical protein [Chlamydiales bacterium]